LFNIVLFTQRNYFAGERPNQSYPLAHGTGNIAGITVIRFCKNGNGFIHKLQPKAFGEFFEVAADKQRAVAGQRHADGYADGDHK